MQKLFKDNSAKIWPISIILTKWSNLSLAFQPCIIQKIPDSDFHRHSGLNCRFEYEVVKIQFFTFLLQYFILDLLGRYLDIHRWFWSRIDDLDNVNRWWTFSFLFCIIKTLFITFLPFSFRHFGILVSRDLISKSNSFYAKKYSEDVIVIIDKPWRKI